MKIGGGMTAAFEMGILFFVGPWLGGGQNRHVIAPCSPAALQGDLDFAVKGLISSH